MCGGTPSLQCGSMVFSAVCLDLSLSEACGVGWVLVTWKFCLKLKDPERKEIPIVKWRIRLYHQVRIRSIHVLCGCLTLIVLWSNPVHFRECSVLGLWFSDFYSRLSPGMLTGYEKILLKQRKAVQIWRKSCISKYFSALFCSPLPPAELVDHYFSYKSLYHEKFMTSQQSAYNCVPCRTGTTVYSIQTLRCLLACMLFIYYFSLSYHYFICSDCFLENIFLQVGIWFKPKLYGGTRRMPTTGSR